MKRFYCKVCKKIKRVRHIPPNTVTPQAFKPTDRIGVCDHHILSTNFYSKGISQKARVS
jgi:hypothetical protein